jgi:signal transduction histidine kinase/ActR/RegA family two-component response regulator
LEVKPFYRSNEFWYIISFIAIVSIGIITLILLWNKTLKQKVFLRTNDLNEMNVKLQKANNALNNAKERAEESDQLKTEFIRNMSHEVRTPLNGILGFSDLLNDPDIDNETRLYFVNVIQNCGNQLLQIIDDILEISRLGTRQVAAIEKELYLSNLFSSLFEEFEPKAIEKGLTLYLKKGFSDNASLIITDENKLKKILIVLLGNALKFTNEGYVEFGYRLVKEKARDLLEIYVKDTGIGINEDKQKLIFKPFTQEEKELSKIVGGLGLGLSIGKQNVKLLGGELILQSIKGQGSTFFVRIPYKKIPDKKSMGETVASNINTLNIGHEFTILIVEDEEINYLYLKTLLEENLGLNCKVLYANNGKQAIEISKEVEELGLVLMDLKMPVMNGFEATKLIKEFRSGLPIVAQTAYSTKEDAEKAIQAGCDDLITKPINKLKFVRMLEKYLQ